MDVGGNLDLRDDSPAVPDGFHGDASDFPGYSFEQPLFGGLDPLPGTTHDPADETLVDGFVPQFHDDLSAFSGCGSDGRPLFEPAAGTTGASLSGPFDPFRRCAVPATQPTLNAVTNEAIFARSLLTNCQATDIVLPWETGIYKELFSDEPFSQTLVPAMPIGALVSVEAEPEPQVVGQQLAGAASFVDESPVFMRCIGSADDGPFNTVQAKLHMSAVNKFLVALRHNLKSSTTGTHILALGSEMEQAAGASAIVEAILGTRSPATLMKRANSLLSYLRWFDRAGFLDIEPFSEECIWRYFQHLRDECAPCTKGSSALSSFRFAFHILGVEGLGPALSSRRLVGICELMLLKKRLLRQSLVLTVAQVKGLHQALRNTCLHVMDRAVIAYLLFALYGRCRHSDLAMIHSVEADFTSAGGFVTVQTCTHKTGRLAILKSRLMPIVIPARGVDGLVWVGDALDVFSKAGMVLETPMDGPLLRAPSGGPDKFMQRGLKSAEVSVLLRKFIGSPDPIPGPNDEVVSSHSLKSTALSWCARFGVSPASRSLLGRHASCLNETYAIYSRDLVCSPVVELQKVIDAIADGSFAPDSQRSKFFATPPGEEAVGPADNGDAVAGFGDAAMGSAGVGTAVSELIEFSGGGVELADTGSEVPSPSPLALGEHDGAVDGPQGAELGGEDSSSSESGGDLSSSESVEMETTARVKRFRAKIPEGQCWFVHSKSHLVHRHDGDEVDGMKFTVCGKRLSSNYVPCTEATAWNVLCKSCNRK